MKFSKQELERIEKTWDEIKNEDIRIKFKLYFLNEKYTANRAEKTLHPPCPERKEFGFKIFSYFSLMKLGKS
jgi:hypothetical protein